MGEFLAITSPALPITLMRIPRPSRMNKLECFFGLVPGRWFMNPGWCCRI